MVKLRAAPRGRFHVNTSNGFGVHQHASAPPRSSLRAILILVELSITDRLGDPVTDHADITVRADRIADTALTACKVAEYERTICAAPAYVAGHSAPATPADLVDHVHLMHSSVDK